MMERHRAATDSRADALYRHGQGGLQRTGYRARATCPQGILSRISLRRCLTARDALSRSSRWTIPVFRYAKAKPCGMARAKRCGARTHVLYGPLCDGGAWGSVAARPPSGNARPLTPQELPATKEPTPGWWNW